MKHILQKYYFGLLLLCLPFISMGQLENGKVSVLFSLPEVALVDIEPGNNNPVNLTLLPPSESGNSSIIEKSADASLWINYSSALPAHQNSRSITAEVAQGQIPSGVKLFLEASAISGGKGQCGISNGKTEISTQPRPIISEIGNCSTGDGMNKGHQISYSIEITDYPQLKSTGNGVETNVLIVYTLTDN